MAAAALPIAADLAGKTIDETKKQLAELEDDPMTYFGHKTRKIGYITLFAGIGALMIGYVAKTMDQSYLNDITGCLGIAPQTPPTHGTPAAPPPSPPPPPVPPQIKALNQIVFDVNSLGTTSASANVALLQDVLDQLWALAGLVWAPIGGVETQTPVPGLGQQIDIAIMQTCTLIYQLEGRAIPKDPSWTWEFWLSQGDTPPFHNLFFTGITSIASQPFLQVGAPDWADAISEVNNNSTGTPFTYKVTINGLAGLLNAQVPFDITSSGGNNPWGVLGTIVSDLGAAGALIESGAVATVNDLVAFAKDVVGVVEDIPSALVLIGKVIINLPRLGFDALGYVAWWAVDMICNAIWWMLIVVGACLIAFSVFALNIYPRIRERLLLGAKAGAAEFWARFDSWFGTRKKIQLVRQDKKIEAAVQQTVQEPVTPPAIVAPEKIVPELPAAPEAPKAPEPAIEPTPTEKTETILGETGTGAPPLPEVSPAPPDASTAVSESPKSVRLSDKQPQEPSEAELASQEAARIETLPEPEPEPKRSRRPAREQMAEAHNAFAQLGVPA